MQTVTLKYGQVAPFEFQTIQQKIEMTPTTVAKAAVLRHVIKNIKEMRKKMSEEYTKEVMEKFGKKGEDGQFLRDEEHPDRILLATDTAEDRELVQKANDEFYAREYSFAVPTLLNPYYLSEVKMTAKEVELLGPLFTEEFEHGPGIPSDSNSNVKNIR